MFIDKFDNKKIGLDKRRIDVRNEKELIDRKATEDKEKLDKELKQLKDTVDDYGNLVEKYSIFKLIDILPVLSDLLTFYNGNKYSYHIDYVEKKGYIITGEFNKVFDILDFVKLENWFNNLNFVSTLEIDELVISFKISKVRDKNCVEFYIYNSVPESLKYHTEVKTEDEKIIKDFIDYVIDYRVSNKVDVISKEDLIRLEKEYLKSKRTDIIAFYKNLDLTEQQELNDKQANRRLKLDKLN